MSNKGQYRKSPRTEFLDYDAGDFFVTICTAGKKHYFGEIEDGKMHYTATGHFLVNQLHLAHKFNNSIEILLFAVMPNHLHFIVHIDCREIPLACSVGNAHQRCPNASLRANDNVERHIPQLSKYISSLKGAVTKYARAIGVEFGWQSRYHDHLIRGPHDGNRIADYIEHNVSNWHKDCFFDTSE